MRHAVQHGISLKENVTDLTGANEKIHASLRSFPHSVRDKKASQAFDGGPGVRMGK